MAVYTNLSGAGSIGLSSGVSALRVDVVIFGNGASIGSAAPADYFKLGALRLGNQGSYYATRYIDGASIILDCPPGVTTLAYSLFTTTTITVTEVFSAISNWQKQPWDRNPTPVQQGSVYTANGGQSNASVWSYTVPASRILGLTHAIAEVSRYQSPTSPNYCQGLVYLNGAVFLLAQLGEFEQVPSVSDALQGGTLYLPAATVVSASYSNASTGGACFVQLLIAGYTFDA